MRVQRLEPKNLSTLPSLDGMSMQMGSEGCYPYMGGRGLEHLVQTRSSEQASLPIIFLTGQVQSQCPGRPYVV